MQHTFDEVVQICDGKAAESLTTFPIPELFYGHALTVLLPPLPRPTASELILSKKILSSLVLAFSV